MFGIEKFDERTQAMALLGGFVIILSVAILIFFLVSMAFVKPDKIESINKPGQTQTYILGMIEVTFKEGIKKADAGNLMSNLGLQFDTPITNSFGRLVYEVKVERGKENLWIDRLKKEPTVYDASLRKVR